MADSLPPGPEPSDGSFPQGGEPREDALMPEASALLFRRYRVIRELGRGGMGVVWLAHDTKLDIPVAVKLVPDLVANDAEAIADLRKEVLRGMALNHDGVVRTHHFEKDETGAGIVMEYVEGDTLADLKAAQPGGCFDPEQIIGWIEQLCSVLNYAHGEARIVHRDLKPRNIMVTKSGKVKVADFGIAAMINDTINKHSMEGKISGTLSYMSPQQAEGKRPSVLDDIHAIGAMIYDLLTGKPPFFRGNQAAIYHQILNVVPPSMAERRSEMGVTERSPIPEAWEETVATCLAKDPAQRPQRVEEVLGRLNSVPLKSLTDRMKRTRRRAIAVGIVVAIVVWALFEGGVFLQMDRALTAFMRRGALIPFDDRGLQYFLIVLFAFAMSWLALFCPRRRQVLVISLAAACELLAAIWVFHVLGKFLSPFASGTTMILAVVSGMIARPRGDGTTHGKSLTIAVIVLSAIAVAELGAPAWMMMTRSQSDSPTVSATLAHSTTKPPGDLPGIGAIDLENPFSDGSGGTSTKPKPAPISSTKVDPQAQSDARYRELMQQSKELRDRGDVSAALVKLREATALDSRNPEAMAEIAIIYEKMGLPDKAAEQWKRVYDLGADAGFYFIAAESRLRMTQAEARGTAQSGGLVSKLRADAVLGLEDVVRQDDTAAGGTSLVLQVPIKTKAGEKIAVADMDIDVRFYDQLDGKTLVLASGGATYRWTKLPIDWSTGQETLEIRYKQDTPPQTGKREKRVFFGYVVRLYYKGQIQDLRAEPETLNTNFPAAPTLSTALSPPAQGMAQLVSSASISPYTTTDDFARYAMKLRDSALSGSTPRISLLPRPATPQPTGSKGAKSNDPSDIRPPFGLSWGETAARLEPMLLKANARIVDKRPTSDGLVAWNVDGLVISGVKRTVFYFRAEKLVGVELIYQRDDWQVSNYDEFMTNIKRNLQGRYGQELQIAHKTETVGSVVQTLSAYEWNRNTASITLCYYAAQDGQHSFRTLSVHYRN